MCPNTLRAQAPPVLGNHQVREEPVTNIAPTRVRYDSYATSDTTVYAERSTRPQIGALFVLARPGSCLSLGGGKRGGGGRRGERGGGERRRGRGAEGGGGGSSSLRTRACEPTGEASEAGERRRAFFARSHSICSPPCSCGGDGDGGDAIGAGGGDGGTGGGSGCACPSVCTVVSAWGLLLHRRWWRDWRRCNLRRFGGASLVACGRRWVCCVHARRFLEVSMRRALSPSAEELAEPMRVGLGAQRAVSGSASLAALLASARLSRSLLLLVLASAALRPWWQAVNRPNHAIG